MIWLAEMIFNFQRTAGLDDALESLGSRKVEETYAELEVGKLLALHGVAFKFQKPEQKRAAKITTLSFSIPMENSYAAKPNANLRAQSLVMVR